MCALALSKKALVSSQECSKINLKVINVSNKVTLPRNDMSHVCIVKKMVRGRARHRAARARTRAIQNHLDKLVEHK